MWDGQEEGRNIQKDNRFHSLPSPLPGAEEGGRFRECRKGGRGGPLISAFPSGRVIYVSKGWERLVIRVPYLYSSSLNILAFRKLTMIYKMVIFSVGMVVENWTISHSSGSKFLKPFEIKKNWQYFLRVFKKFHSQESVLRKQPESQTKI